MLEKTAIQIYKKQTNKFVDTANLLYKSSIHFAFNLFVFIQRTFYPYTKKSIILVSPT